MDVGNAKEVTPMDSELESLGRVFDELEGRVATLMGRLKSVLMDDKPAAEENKPQTGDIGFPLGRHTRRFTERAATLSEAVENLLSRLAI